MDVLEKPETAAPFVRAIGGSRLCTKADIAAGNYEKIRDFCKKAVQIIREERA